MSKGKAPSSLNTGDSVPVFVTVTGEQEAKRLDAGLACLWPEYSRSYLQKLVKSGAIVLNGRPAKGSTLLALGDVISAVLPPLEAAAAQPEAIALDVVYEDKDIIIINKPRGMVVHPAAGNYDGTLVNALLFRKDLSGIGGALRPGIVHRLDKETSGLLVAAKNDLAHRGLQSQWPRHQVSRVYMALVEGMVNEPGGTIDAPIGRHPVNRKKMAVLPDGGRSAVTHYRVMERFAGYTFLRVQLETGRTHQIRVHMSYLGHPVAGDIVYGHKKWPVEVTGQYLHAAEISLLHPISGAPLHFTAPLPDDFTAFLQNLRTRR